MIPILIFAVVLFLAVLLSGWAERTILSIAVLFLIAGFLAGPGVLHLIAVEPGQWLVRLLAELALFSVLFTDGMKVNWRSLTSAWKLPGKALFGIPLTMVGIALLAHYIAGRTWAESFLLGAVLSPTDPVFAAALVGRPDVPDRLRHLLNVESGLNDGLALPLVLGILTWMGQDGATIPRVLAEMGEGIGLGVAVPWIAVWLCQLRLFHVAPAYHPLFAFDVGVLVLRFAGSAGPTCSSAAFAAGITLSSVHPNLSSEFRGFGETLTELFKSFAILLFGALISPQLLAAVPGRGYLFVILSLVVVRPIAMLPAFLDSGLTWQEEVAAAWFGPKGFASVVYGILVLQSSVPGHEELFHLIAVVVALSIIVHSSTDVVIAGWFRK